MTTPVTTTIPSPPQPAPNVMPANATNSVISPNIVTADNYLNDVIVFQLLESLTPTSIVRTFTIPYAAERDFAGFVMVGLSDAVPSYYSVSMIGPIYSREAVAKVIDTEISELLNA